MQYYNLNLPFYYKGLNFEERYKYPETLPFKFNFDDKFGLLRQHASAQVIDILSKVYLSGSLFEGSLSNDSGQLYYEPFTQFIIDYTLSKDKVLEIGSGQGNLLKWLKQHFENAIGIDPQEQLQESVKVVRDFFPSNKIDQDFDVIIHYGVLEHIEVPRQFLINQHKHHKKGGKLIIAVPNCSEFIEDGDISMFFHEHFSYFNIGSLKSLVASAGYRTLHAEIQLGMIFLVAEMDPENVIHIDFKSKDKEFQQKVIDRKEKFENIIQGYEQTQIAFYPAIRVLNHLNELGLNNVHLIDDSKELEGKYLPTQENKVAPLDYFIQNPPQLIVITSRTFGNVLSEKIQKYDAFKNTTIKVF